MINWSIWTQLYKIPAIQKFTSQTKYQLNNQNHSLPQDITDLWNIFNILHIYLLLYWNISITNAFKNPLKKPNQFSSNENIENHAPKYHDHRMLTSLCNSIHAYYKLYINYLKINHLKIALNWSNLLIQKGLLYFSSARQPENTLTGFNQLSQICYLIWPNVLHKKSFV